MEGKKGLLGKDTLVPLSLVVVLCGGVFWISNQLGSINHKLDLLEQKLEDQWTRRDMENWALKLKLKNPEITLPD